LVRTIHICLILAALGGNPSHAGDPGRGKELFQQCNGCHSVETGEGKAGPSLRGIFKREKLRNGKPATEKNVRERIEKGGNGMPSFERILSERETDRLIEYLRQL
jgi:cytochrome c